MPQPFFVSGALFDIKPVDDSGRLDVQKINTIGPVINLASQKNETSVPLDSQVVLPPSTKSVRVVSKQPPFSIHDEFTREINGDLNIGVELARFGATVPRIVRPRKQPTVKTVPVVQNNQVVSQEKLRRVEPSKKTSDIFPSFDLILSEIRRVPDPSLSDTAAVSDREGSSDVAIRPEPLPAMAPAVLAPLTPTVIAPLTVAVPVCAKAHTGRRTLIIVVIVAGLALACLGYAWRLKHTLTTEGVSAVGNLQNAQQHLASLDFGGASQDFLAAYQNFTSADSTLNFLGSTVTSAIGSLPGGGTVKSAQNLVTFGQLMSDAGAAMTTALNTISKAGSLLDPSGNTTASSLISIMTKALSISQKDVAQAATIRANIDDSIIPADQRDKFQQFADQLPQFAQLLGAGADYAQFFGNAIGTGDSRYLILFENASELRPTGGFPGTYAVVSFHDGRLQDFFVDDVYNIDGQLKEDIIPPAQLQSITPNWGMRDANWFVDYPTSAKKVAQFYQAESGQSVDGVIAVNTAMISQIMSIVGPISMPQYGLTLNSDNILTTIQSQVEYGPNRTQPKQIIKDFAPLLLQKITAASGNQWSQIFNTLISGLSQNQVLMYFNNLSLENFATEKGFGGQVQDAPDDYVMPVIANVKGSKTDAVIDTSFDLSVKFDGSDALDTLTITRHHNGGDSQFGFYNKQNPAYVRVLIPEGATLESIAGNDDPDYKPLISYTGTDFTNDPDLKAFETSGTTDPTTDVTTYQEAGKSEFGFWLITDPGATKTVTVTYRVPGALKSNNYSLYIQKQPGLVVKNFSFSLVNPSGMSATASSPTLTATDSDYTYTAPLTGDLPISVQFK